MRAARPHAARVCPMKRLRKEFLAHTMCIGTLRVFHDWLSVLIEERMILARRGSPTRRYVT